MKNAEKETLKHIRRVGELLRYFSDELMIRARKHDRSKLESPEKELYKLYTHQLEGCTYGSDEYKELLEKIRPALNNHYARNSHHPEFYENGMNGFDLWDLVEMFFDWKAASERHKNGNIRKSLDINRERFGISDQLYDILLNTIDRLGW